VVNDPAESGGCCSGEKVLARATGDNKQLESIDGDDCIRVTNLQNVAIARKQNLAGVVKANKIGRMWAVSD